MPETRALERGDQAAEAASHAAHSTLLSHAALLGHAALLHATLLHAPAQQSLQNAANR